MAEHLQHSTMNWGHSGRHLQFKPIFNMPDFPISSLGSRNLDASTQHTETHDPLLDAHSKGIEELNKLLAEGAAIPPPVAYGWGFNGIDDKSSMQIREALTRIDDVELIEDKRSKAIQVLEVYRKNLEDHLTFGGCFKFKHSQSRSVWEAINSKLHALQRQRYVPEKRDILERCENFLSLLATLERNSRMDMQRISCAPKTMNRELPACPNDFLLKCSEDKLRIIPHMRRCVEEIVMLFCVGSLGSSEITEGQISECRNQIEKLANNCVAYTSINYKNSNTSSNGVAFANIRKFHEACVDKMNLDMRDLVDRLTQYIEAIYGAHHSRPRGE